MTKNDQQMHSRRPPVTEHTVDCTGQVMLWQAPWMPGAQRLGHCRSCGAVAVTTARPAAQREDESA